MRDPRRLGAFGPTRVHTSGPRFVSEVSASGGELSRPPMDTHAKSCPHVYKDRLKRRSRPFPMALHSGELQIGLWTVGMHTGTIQSRTKSKLLTCRFPALPSASWRPGGHPRASRRNGGSRGAGESCWGRGVLTGESDPLSHRATDTRTGRAQRSKLELSVDGRVVPWGNAN